MQVKGLMIDDKTLDAKLQQLFSQIDTDHSQYKPD
jgi:hypothetical protein